MKIGIITFVNEDNYGAVLQAYAMQNFLRIHQFESEFINVKLKELVKCRTRLVDKIKYKIAFFRKQRSFSKFRKKLQISNGVDVDKYDALIIGSDQVWNPMLTGDKLQSLFFGGSFDKKIIAYACSCGCSQVLDSHLPELKEYLNRIKYISVREKSLEIYLREQLGIATHRVLDPVFLLDKQNWIEMFELENRFIDKKYIFVYLLEDSELITDAINELSRKNNLVVVSLRNSKHYINEVKRYPGADPKRFLQLLYNAELVVTNSFHATAFSYIFGKDIALFKHSMFNERIGNMLDLIGIEDGYYTKDNKVISFATYNAVYNDVDVERNKSIKYILEALNVDNIKV